MKEFSIEDKAKAYDKAIEKLRSLHDDYDTVSTLIDIEEELENIFPELRESEDEKIRKWIIKQIKTYDPSIIKDKSLAWLEKQGEQKPIITEDKDAETAAEEYKNFRMSCGIKNQVILHEIEEAYYEGAIRKQKPVIIPKFREGDIIKRKDTDETFEVSKIEVIDANEIYYHLTNGGCICENSDNFELVEQKPTWSEEDEYHRNIILYCLNNESVGKADKENAINWLKSLKDRVQPKQEWSEEDKKALKVVTDIFRLFGVHLLNYPAFMHWLKTLPNRITFNPYWKPSDEQMEQLCWIAKQNKDNIIGKELISLYHDLLKLKG